MLCIGLLIMSIAFSQEKAIKITHPDSGEEIIIKETRRIRVQMADGRKVSGKFMVIDSQNIRIKEKQIKLSDIIKLKQHPLLLTLATNAFLIYSGLNAVAAGLVLYAFSDGQWPFLLITALGSGAVYSGIFTAPNILKGYKRSNHYTYQIISIPVPETTLPYAP